MSHIKVHICIHAYIFTLQVGNLIELKLRIILLFGTDRVNRLPAHSRDAHRSVRLYCALEKCTIS